MRGAFSMICAPIKHTDAFKINEDVVIPLERLGEYTDAIERINIELSIRNKLELLDALDDYFSGDIKAGKTADVDMRRKREAHDLLAGARARWQYLLGAVDTPVGEARAELDARGITLPVEALGTIFDKLQDRSIRVSWKSEVLASLTRIFGGAAFAQVLAECEAVHKRVLQGRVFVALHMHAGDGNVHTNIPVNSDNYAMLHADNRTVARIMRIARSLDGVISGEHGIGITKLEFLTEAELASFRAYKMRIDPDGRFNKHKLMPGSDLRHAYTPSFGLLGHESLIMQQSDINTISDAIKDCLR